MTRSPRPRPPTPAGSAWPRITRTRSPARRTGAGWSSTSGWTGRERSTERSPERRRAAGSFGGEVREIASPSNPTFRRLRVRCSAAPASASTARRSSPARGSATRSWPQFPEQVLGWLTDTGGPPPPSESIPWLRLADPLFKELDVAGTHAPLLLVRVPEMPAWTDEEPWPDGCTLFVPFQDPENVGAVIRSAAAFGVARVVLLREAAHPFHPRSSRAAGPALFQVPLHVGPRLAELRAAGAPLIAMDTTGPELSEAPFPERFGLVVGVEGPGLPAHLREGRAAADRHAARGRVAQRRRRRRDRALRLVAPRVPAS